MARNRGHGDSRFSANSVHISAIVNCQLYRAKTLPWLQCTRIVGAHNNVRPGLYSVHERTELIN